MLEKTVVSVIFTAFMVNAPLEAQTDDSLLLEKIKNIDITLNSLEETEEDLYLNPVSFQTFYDELAPVGEWIQITKEEIEQELKDGDGQSYSSNSQEDGELVFIWRPVLDEQDWKPYTNGKWVYTEHGWLWASDYKWGWAVHHYGRWWNSGRYGWVWLPGYVWAPAWVVWRVSDNHAGWCPLSPSAKWRGTDGITIDNYTVKNKDADWVFVEKTKFVNEIDRTVMIPQGENKKFVSCSQTILDLKPDNGKIINRGPDVADIETKTGKKIGQKKVKFNKEKIRALIGESDVSLFKADFKKLGVDASTGKYMRFDKPAKFKKSPKVKKIIKRRKIEHKKRWKKTGGSIEFPLYM